MLILFLASLYLPAGTTYGQKSRNEAQKITVATVQSKAATVIQQYACQIHSQRRVNVRTPKNGYLNGGGNGDEATGGRGNGDAISCFLHVSILIASSFLPASLFPSPRGLDQFTVGTETAAQLGLVPSTLLGLISLTLSFPEHGWSASKAGITCGVPDRITYCASWSPS
jgi:hypothetical protein